MQRLHEPVQTSRSAGKPTSETRGWEVGIGGAEDRGMKNLTVTAENYPMVRRLDRNDDGTIEPQEAEKALLKAGPSNVIKEINGLSAEDREVLHSLQSKESVRIDFGDHVISDKESWNAVRDELYAKQANEPARLGTVGQGRPGAIRNDDCGPTGGLFMHDLRLARTGNEVPQRTHAETDALIDRIWGKGGTNGPQMKNVMNKHFYRAGNDQYEFTSERVPEGGLKASLEKGLASDPGGVLVPIISTYNESSRTGTPHWIVVTDMKDDKVAFYDPGGMDGANHLSETTVSDLEGWLSSSPGLLGHQVVYGKKLEPHQRRGELEKGQRIGELEVLGFNEDLHVKSTRGVFDTKEAAVSHAQAISWDDDQDAIVRAEGAQFAVYGITEIAPREGGFGSANEVVDLDPAVTDVLRGPR